ncbi:hypothetical protein AVEN_149406-1 [Araneus ventricosus]|uniref:Uncharacterized protein n=1 Tax=Araneus ventricosus TaxID=182803 RepID=A0A4Y2JKV3_ARAVE|nr:hypothetical protein AVEN_149406-1 [Araneus ventricosus]
MSSKRKIEDPKPAENVLKRSKKSWQAVTSAENYFMEGRYGKALPLLFKYEDCEARAMMFLAYMYFEGVGCVEDMVNKLYDSFELENNRMSHSLT